MNTPPPPDPVAIDELAKIADKIMDPSLRRDFDNDPLGTLTRAGVDVNALPPAVQEFLADLSYSELRLLARMQDTMVASGLYAQTSYGTVAHL